VTTRAPTARARVTELREALGAQMVLIRELSAQLQTLDRRLRSLEETSGLPIDLRDRPRRTVDPDPHLGRF